MEVPEIEKQIGISLYSTDTEGLGGRLRQEVEDFIVKEITNREEGKDGKYLVLELTKRDWDTHHFTRTLAKILQISQKRINVAGTKDKRALTTQKISIFDVDASVIEKIHLKDVELKILGRSRKSVELGDLWGNEFIITIRGIASSTEKTGAMLEKTNGEVLAQGGVPNFFGIQRFGSVRPVTHLVGKAIVEGDFEKAAMLYIAEPFPEEPEETKAARQFVKETRDFKEGLKTYPLRLGHERAMMNHLIANPEDYPGAFRVLPKNLYRMFVHAYQSYIYNMILCRRIESGISLNRAVEGDIVCFRNEAGLPDSSKTEKVTSETVNAMNRLIKHGRAFITAPLPGFNTGFASVLPGEIESTVLKELGVSLEGFNVEEFPEMSSKGTRREVLLQVEPKFEVTEDELNPGKSKAALEFMLPKGSYATTVLREYMKVDPLQMS
ncbi:tRNA pseudouridine 13 synthase [Methanosarcina siciliae C2J]|uniref:Probable tRNA pseudouridine synthase D n=3 Tax=Methanosarcina siciliae TaxID=38027 RepID=A0A0E3PGM3_9EURY|nr:tRNA pseudouridine(13) synthase TruD [Methanosarcina siciliae]AKB29230.1 tRNA pseudouridine 13 synthase [Methanosarcina siciliae T4/M]AKB33159.1 tRNA pseudouridine 13 synthase [Methanosarcina siciliae HI350]AKB36336.1 tRNA pseudouridine 13 synthase [Methanosarcina siciliae C2J]